MIIVVTPYENLTMKHIERLLCIAPRISGVILRTPMGQEMLAHWIVMLLDTGFPKSKVIVHTDITLAKRLGIRRLHFREGDTTAYRLKDQNPSYSVSMSVHCMASIIEARKHYLDFGIYGHIFSSASKPGQAPRTIEEQRQALSVQWPLIAIGGIDMATVSDVTSHFAGIACIRSAFETSKETFDVMVQQWQIIKRGRK
ncbi:thiamine phosphate synthase [Staphylococcus americanisciuri]|uniref:Thiamine phosphate synthase n=1 Tax=Staphylococcus americanisciuri TaxID=2973940 RepID=A0ABT2F269_9STAP|nr:thiamine phosphate synthase [Staphylococcus americanisciuri]MCS4486464.1 thiamine phosphate synthase [Staphylococcus americanisciuri]